MKFGTVDRLPSGKWRARYRHQGERQRTLRGTFPTEDEARDALEVEFARRKLGLRNEAGDARRPRALLAYAEGVLAAREYRPRTRANHRALLRGILSEFVRRDLAEVTPHDVRMWWQVNSEHPVNRRNAFFLLRVVFGSAVDDGLIDRDPTRAIKKPEAVGSRRPDFTVEDYRTVAARLEPMFRVPVQVAFAAHLRLGELLALKVEDYDEASGWLIVDDAVDLNGVPGPTKTGQTRKVVVLREGQEALKSHIASAEPGPMFRGPKGGPLRRATLRKAWLAACEEAEIAGFRFHDLRHIGLTEVARAGANIADLKARSGHASVSALAGYLHSDPHRAEEIAKHTDRRLESGERSVGLLKPEE